MRRPDTSPFVGLLPRHGQFLPRAHWVCPVAVLVEKKLKPHSWHSLLLYSFTVPVGSSRTSSCVGQYSRCGRVLIAHVPEAPTTLAEWLAAATIGSKLASNRVSSSSI